MIFYGIELVGIALRYTVRTPEYGLVSLCTKLRHAVML